MAAINLSDGALQAELTRLIASQDKKWIQALDHLQQAGVQGVEKAKSILEKTNATTNEKLKQKLKERFEKYKEPLMTLEKFTEVTNLKSKYDHQRLKNRELEKHIQTLISEQDKECPRIVSFPVTDAIPGGYTFLRESEALSVRPETQVETGQFDPGKKTQKRENGRITAYHPVTGRPFDIPLQYSDILTLNNFETKIITYPLNITLDLFSTISELLDYSQELGLSRQQLCEVLRLVIKKFKPAFYFTIEKEKDTKKLFRTILDLVNIDELTGVIRQELKQFKRGKNENVYETSSKYMSLVTTKMSHELHHLDSKVIKSRAERQTLLALSEMLAPATKTQLDGWKRRRQLNGEEIKLDEVLKWVHDIEGSNEVYRIQEDCHPAESVNIAEVSLHNSEFEVSAFVTENPYARTFQGGGRLSKGDSNSWERNRGGRGRGGRGRGTPPSRGRGGRGGRGAGRGGGRGGQSHPSDRGGHHSRRDSQGSGGQRDHSHDQPRGRSATPFRPPSPANQNVGHNDFRGRGNRGSRGRGFPRGRGNRGGWQGRSRSHELGKGDRNQKKKNPKNIDDGDNSENSPPTCEKCQKLGHSTASCWTYEVLMPSNCRKCYKGRHDTALCVTNLNKK